MAPESERAKMCEHDAGGMYDGPTNIWCALGCGALLECVCLRKQYCLVHPSLSRARGLSKQSIPPAPASCSEVVERLRNEAYVAENWIVKRKSSFSVTKAEAILHSWRERRVQELPILEKFEDEQSKRKQEVERAYEWLKAQYESGRFKKAPMKDFADGLAQLLATYHREAKQNGD